MWPKYSFSSDFDDIFFGYDSVDFKRKKFSKVKKKNFDEKNVEIFC